MKANLTALYETKKKDFVRIYNQFPADSYLYGPFLMSPNDSYLNQKRKLLVIGKESNGWSCHVDDVEKQMGHYENFNVGETYYASPFWSITRYVEEAIGNDSLSCAWSNFSKFDVNQGSPYGEFEKAISTLDDLIIDEIKIVKPSVCIFFTGPTLDDRLKKVFEGVKFESCDDWSIRALSRLVHPNLPQHTYRVYHPNYLRRKHYEGKFIEFMGSI